MGAEAVRDGRGIAKPVARRALRVVARHPLPFVISNTHLQMELELVVDVGLDVRAEEAEVAAPARGHVVTRRGALARGRCASRGGREGTRPLRRFPRAARTLHPSPTDRSARPRTAAPTTA